ncbi:MAG TPA: peptidogalycan biosysnthesis protein, partial [Pseudomonadales bacterium]|nr:peptidogalycan biosysnthesis protein [Pseudomonadales bacterium]
YQGIEYCIERGLQKFDPGVQGEHKLARGFEPVLTHSFHYIDEPAFQQPIQHFLEEEAAYIKQYQLDAIKALPFKQKDDSA